MAKTRIDWTTVLIVMMALVVVILLFRFALWLSMLAIILALGWITFNMYRVGHIKTPKILVAIMLILVLGLISYLLVYEVTTPKITREKIQQEKGMDQINKEFEDKIVTPCKDCIPNTPGPNMFNKSN